MITRLHRTVLCILSAAAISCAAAHAQQPAAPPAPQTPKAAEPSAGSTGVTQRLRTQNAPVSNVTVDGSEAMFATMCALLAAGFESDVSAENWSPVRAQLRDRLQHQQGPAVDAVREFYKKHELADAGAMLSQYIWFGLVSGPAPKFVPVLRRDELPPKSSPWKASAKFCRLTTSSRASGAYGFSFNRSTTAKSANCTTPFRRLFS